MYLDFVDKRNAFNYGDKATLLVCEGKDSRINCLVCGKPETYGYFCEANGLFMCKECAEAYNPLIGVTNLTNFLVRYKPERGLFPVEVVVNG